jgi:very-short-patch-repair endonuclease
MTFENRPDFKILSKTINNLSKENIKKFLIENKKYFVNEFFLRFYIKYIYFDDEIIFNKQIPNTKIRPDALIKNKKIIIEYDGPLHFTNNSTVLKDIKKNKILQKLGYNIIRIPHFIEMGKEELKILFDYDDINNIHSNYFSGFIHKDVILPSDFCERGINRYINDTEYNFFNNNIIKKKILKTLVIKCFEKTSIQEVFPPKLFNIANNMLYDNIINNDIFNMKNKYLKFEEIINYLKFDLNILSLENNNFNHF